MFDGQFVFTQLMHFLPRREFNACVERYQGQRRERGFSCRDQFLCLAFAQLTYRESLRDIETCLRALEPKLYHAGFRGQVSRSTLADANRAHDWRIYSDFAQILIRRARRLYASERLAVDLEQTVYALDSTTIDLCLSLFPWAKFRRRKGAVKLHTLLDLRGSIPCFIHISHGKMHDLLVLDQLPIEPGAFYVMDRGYVDFARLHRFTQHSAFFVTRAKRNLDATRRSRRPVDKSLGLRCDQTILLSGPKSSRLYPDPLRRVAFYDVPTQRRFAFLTNNFALPALTIAELYRSRWQVELFFKWIKQHLRIKAFYGTSDNAVKTQVWIAVSVYVLVAIIKKELRLDRSLADILQILSVTLFEKTQLFEALSVKNPPVSEQAFPNQLKLFD
ncbi:IS4 family transposase [Planctomicrobium piriforme]|uniref:Transposase DDE domain-containing protein n=1 Tax=Planctomicrobium piriforme TaxID=1576369 RepID=A0A1I3TM75_9PLAN|nr:IS4 family transposase [Planctomicrobium piriforme]SFJ71955.1 Transposase DDE domain-containing protein [Planctomicrobium piriforme]